MSKRWKPGDNCPECEFDEVYFERFADSWACQDCGWTKELSCNNCVEHAPMSGEDKAYIFLTVLVIVTLVIPFTIALYRLFLNL